MSRNCVNIVPNSQGSTFAYVLAHREEDMKCYDLFAFHFWRNDQESEVKYW
jgi:hypothetical protein